LITVSGKLRFQYRTDNGLEILNGDGTFDSVSTINNGAWHHVALVRRGNRFTIMIDGVVDRTGIDNAGLNTLTSANQEIGSYDNGTLGFWDGQVDEVRFESIGREPSDFKTQYNNMNATSTFYSVGSQEGRRTKVRLGSL
jgi:hypothetical protein